METMTLKIELSDLRNVIHDVIFENITDDKIAQVVYDKIECRIEDDERFKEADQWHEGLPENSGWYLVSLVNNRNGYRFKLPLIVEYNFNTWQKNDLFSNDIDETVTHWMPLPTPPEEVTGDA